MSYTHHHTQAIVIGLENHGEGSRLVTLLTKDYGVIRALAQSVREIRSKQRFGLQLFSYSEVTLILGREYWRLAGVTPIRNYGMYLAERPLAHGVLSRNARLIRRLVAGEEPHEELFNELKNAFDFLYNQSLTDETIQYFETLLVIRTLHHLGYWSQEGTMPWIVDAEISQEILFQTVDNQENLIERINNSLQETQL